MGFHALLQGIVPTQGLNPQSLTSPALTLIAQLVKNPPAMQESTVRYLGWEIPWRRDRLPTLVFLGFPCVSAGRESACNVGVLGLIPGLGRSPGEGKGDLFTCIPSSILAWRIPWTDHGVTKSLTQLGDFHFHFLFFFTTSATWESHSSRACSFLDSSIALSSLNSSFLKVSSSDLPPEKPVCRSGSTS